MSKFGDKSNKNRTKVIVKIVFSILIVFFNHHRLKGHLASFFIRFLCQ